MKEIGGYFELELSKKSEYHQNAICLNTGRNAFEYILRLKKYRKVYLPYFTCDVMLEPIFKLNIDYEFYPITETFYPNFIFSQLNEDEAFVYNNYFGICDRQVKEVIKQGKNIIIDNSQAFYSKPIPGIDTFYSPRKFFGIPDGAYLYSNKIDYELEPDSSVERCSHLLGRIEIGAEKYYSIFKQNSLALVNSPIKQMSMLTRRILNSIDYEYVSQRRKDNYKFLNEALSIHNDFKLSAIEEGTPMVYPFLSNNGKVIKKKLIENKIFIATYWPNVKQWCQSDSFEYRLYENLIPLPIDQRYGKDDMLYIINQIIQ